MNILKRIFKPTTKAQSLYYIVIVQALIRSGVVIAWTEILRLIIQSVESDNIGSIPEYLTYLICIAIIFIINQFVTSHKTLSTLWPKLYGVILKEYMELFFNLDVTYTEKIWTWRFINIIQKGAESWFFYALGNGMAYYGEYWEFSIFCIIRLGYRHHVWNRNDNNDIITS